MKSVQLISYQYPDLVKVSIEGTTYLYRTSEPWARKAMNQMKYGEGWRGVNILKQNGVLVDGGDEK